MINEPVTNEGLHTTMIQKVLFKFAHSKHRNGFC